jgi:hypothetical protein
MTTKFLGVLAAVPMLAMASVASAEEAKPVVLDAQSLDGVTAAGSAIGFADAFALGSSVATFTATLAAVEVLDTVDFEAGGLSLVGSISAAEAISVSE